MVQFIEKENESYIRNKDCNFSTLYVDDWTKSALRQNEHLLHSGEGCKGTPDTRMQYSKIVNMYRLQGVPKKVK